MVDGAFRDNTWTIDSWLNQTLPASDYEVIWVDYKNRIPRQFADRANFRNFCLNRTEEMQRLALCFNEGIRQAKGNFIVIPDADVVCEPDLLETVRKELDSDNETVVYVMRLDQPRHLASNVSDLDTLRKTCFIKHTFNYGGCSAVHKKWLLKMNGYEQLPFFAGYHYNGGDNYIRFKNMGLKIKWHTTARVYHPWHPLPEQTLFSTSEQQEQFLRQRAASWDWLAHEGIDENKNRAYQPHKVIGEWPEVYTERGIYSNSGSAGVKQRKIHNLLSLLKTKGFLRGVSYAVAQLLLRIAK
jgi:glycosyltransferase involved in cell wall biosynthesis